MTISSLTNRNDYTGTDATGTYNYTYKIFDEDDLTLVVKEISTSIETELTIATDYTVANVGNSSGGTITLVDNGQAWIGTSNNLNTTYKLTIKRIADLQQETDIRNQGQYFPEVIEDVFDRTVMISQQQQAMIDASIKLPTTVLSADFDTTLPVGLVGTADATIAVNGTGDGFVVGPSASQITAASGNAVAAAASAAAALVSENNAAASEVAAAEAAAASGIPFVKTSQAISSGGQIVLEADENIQFCRVSGNAGTQTASTTPFSTTPGNNILVSLIGTDNINQLVITYNDIAGGCLINGASVFLGNNDIINFVYDATEDRYIETSRNF